MQHGRVAKKRALKPMVFGFSVSVEILEQVLSIITLREPIQCQWIWKMETECKLIVNMYPLNSFRTKGLWFINTNERWVWISRADWDYTKVNYKDNEQKRHQLHHILNNHLSTLVCPCVFYMFLYVFKSTGVCVVMIGLNDSLRTKHWALVPI